MTQTEHTQTEHKVTNSVGKEWTYRLRSKDAVALWMESGVFSRKDPVVYSLNSVKRHCSVNPEFWGPILTHMQQAANILIIDTN